MAPIKPPASQAKAAWLVRVFLLPFVVCGRMEGGDGAAVCEAGMLPAEVDVLVIGGGISGLVAANALQGHFKLGVLEARPRVGGRLFSTPGGADLGGSWSWSHDRRVAALMQRVGATAVPQRLDGETMHKQGGSIRGVGNLGDRVAPCGPGARRIVGGYDELPKRLAAELPRGSLCLGCTASKIERAEGSDTVRVTYTQGSTGMGEQVVEARRVILALPPQVVARTLTFEPLLPAEQKHKMLATATWCGDWAKVVATFKTPFWRSEGKSGVAATQDGDDLVSVWWEAEGGDKAGQPAGALAGLAFGAAGARLGAYESLPDGSSGQALHSRVARELTVLFGDRVESELVAVHHKAWILDELTYGPASDSPPGDPRMAYGHRLLRAPLPWGVHFAGTETEAQSGHVEGAIAAGERAAQEVMKALK